MISHRSCYPHLADGTALESHQGSLYHNRLLGLRVEFQSLTSFFLMYGWPWLGTVMILDAPQD